jgi:amino acid transporter
MASSNIESNKKLGVFSLTFIGLSAMLGSGWLLSAYFVFQQAGTYSIISWLLGYSMVIIVALSFAETCSVISEDGATVILPRISHGYFLSALFGFFGLISWIALIPIEVTATMQYLTYFINGLYIKVGQLSIFGYVVAICLAIAISIINCFAMTWIKMLNNFIFTPLKIGIPLIIVAYSIYHASYHPQAAVNHFHSLQGIFAAIPLGVIFSFNAFKTVCVISGKVSNPHKTILKALLLSLSLCLLLYIGLQLAFNLNATDFVILHSHSPYAAILGHSLIMLLLLYIGAVSSPFTANVFNLHAGNACLYRMAKLNYLPKIFCTTNRYGQYILANLFNVSVAILLLARGGAWHEMVSELTCIMVITYAAAPIALISFRKNLQSIDQVLKLKYGTLIGFMGFVFSNFMIFWCGYPAIILALKALLLITLFVVAYKILCAKEDNLDLLRALWVYIWLGGIGLIAHFSIFGGNGLLSHIDALLLLLLLSMALYWVIARTCLSEVAALANFHSYNEH